MSINAVIDISHWQSDVDFAKVGAAGIVGVIHDDKTEQTLQSCRFWLAEYGSTPVVPDLWPIWTMWQYTDGVHGPEPHSVDGAGNCDRDHFNGSFENLRKLLGYTT